MTFLLFTPTSDRWVDFVTLIVQSHFDALLRLIRVISDIPWSSCFESYGPKDTRLAQMKL